MKNIFLAVFMTAVSVISASAQDFASGIPKRNFELGIYVPSGKVAARVKIRRFLIEDNLKILYSDKSGYHQSWNELRFAFTFKNSPSRRFYIGTGMDFRTEYYSREYWYLDGYLINFIGVEFYPSVQVPELSISPEVMCWNLSDVYANISIFYCLGRKK